MCPPRWSHWVIRSFYWLFKAIGLATVSLRIDSKNKRQLWFKSSTSGRFYNVFLSCALAALSSASMPQLFMLKYANKTNISRTADMFQGALGFVTMCTILLYFALKSSTIERICNHLVQVEEQFRCSQASFSLWRTFWNLLTILVLQVATGVAVLVLDHYAFQDGPLIWAAIFLPATFGNNVCFHYGCVVSLLRVNFTRTNRSIRLLCRNSKDSWKSTSRSRQIFDNSATLQAIRRLRNIHDELCDACGVVSRFYSFPCLLILAFMFYSFLFNSYYLFLPLVLHGMDSDVLVILSTASMLIYLVFPFAVLASKITNLVGEIRSTANEVHAFLKVATDRETSAELTQFSFNLLKRPISFTASEYFKIENSLMRSMLSTVVTYLVILIQYEVTETSLHVCNCDCTRQ